MSREDIKARPAVISCAGAMISLALHLLLIAPGLMGFGTNTQRPSDSGEIGAAVRDAPSASMTVTFFDEPDPGTDSRAEVNDGLAGVPALHPVSISAPLPELNLPAESESDASRSASAGSGQPDPVHQLLFGRYIGQITARVERAWMRPRTPIGDSPSFACRVRITQDRNGVVREVELVRCNGSPRWQTSLVQAIQSASPLPAPPDADVYRGEVVLDLQSATFTPGASAEGFEPDAVATIGKAVER
jgi:TonB family protein